VVICRESRLLGSVNRHVVGEVYFRGFYLCCIVSNNDSDFSSDPVIRHNTQPHITLASKVRLIQKTFVIQSMVFGNPSLYCKCSQAASTSSKGGFDT